jgi:hypothetical protein
MLVPGNSFTIHGRGGQRSIRELLLDQMQPTYCPVPNFFCAQIGAQVSVQELADAPLILGPLHIEHAELGSAHDGPCTAYHISDGQSTLVYASRRIYGRSGTGPRYKIGAQRRLTHSRRTL